MAALPSSREQRFASQAEIRREFGRREPPVVETVPLKLWSVPAADGVRAGQGLVRTCRQLASQEKVQLRGTVFQGVRLARRLSGARLGHESPWRAIVGAHEWLHRGAQGPGQGRVPPSGRRRRRSHHWAVPPAQPHHPCDRGRRGPNSKPSRSWGSSSPRSTRGATDRHPPQA